MGPAAFGGESEWFRIPTFRQNKAKEGHQAVRAGGLLFAQNFSVVLLAVVVLGISHGTEVALSAVASPAVVVVPGAFKAMGKEQIAKVGANFQGKVLFTAETTVGQALVVFRAGSARDRRKRAAVGTAHNELQVAVAYLCHGVSSWVHCIRFLAVRFLLLK